MRRDEEGAVESPLPRPEGDDGRESAARKRRGRGKEEGEEAREGDGERWRLGKDCDRGWWNAEQFGECGCIPSLLD